MAGLRNYALAVAALCENELRATPRGGPRIIVKGEGGDHCKGGRGLLVEIHTPGPYDTGAGHGQCVWLMPYQSSAALRHGLREAFSIL